MTTFAELFLQAIPMSSYSSSDRDMITRVVTSLTKETSDLGGSVAVSLIKLQTNGSALNFRETIKSTLSTVSVKTVGRNFLAVVGIEIVEVLMEYAKSSGLTDIKNQWLYVISDANRYKSDVGHLKKLLKEGDNVAFIYNTTGGSMDCVVILKFSSVFWSNLFFSQNQRYRWNLKNYWFTINLWRELFLAET